ncbi:YbaN family protein [Yoonia tamlensis]|uniref:YbaN family protein n=1 Tax=Yoonia tamlensis TaxID=390270 RepID=UPI001F61A3E5|nr:YbaN family protein [Yoonia tamlensis]
MRHIKASKEVLVRGIWLAIGWAALGLGIIGVVLPVLPTTPFVILAAFAFGKGSERLQQRLHDHATFGPIIAEWNATGAIAPKYKTIAITMMSAALGLSIIMAMPFKVIVIQAICMAGAATFILTRPNGAG